MKNFNSIHVMNPCFAELLDYVLVKIVLFGIIESR
jgi:hypothetical protein